MSCPVFLLESSEFIKDFMTNKINSCPAEFITMIIPFDPKILYAEKFEEYYGDMKKTS